MRDVSVRESRVGGTICENIKDNCKNTMSSSLDECNLFKAKSTSGESLEVIYTSRPTLYATFDMGEQSFGTASLNSLIPDI